MEGVEQNENLKIQGHKRYEMSFKSGLYIKVVADLLYILIDFLVIFLPIFEIESLGFTVRFSFYDEVKNIIKNFSFSDMFAIYFLIIVVPIIFAQIVRLVKDISGLFSIEVYAIENYNKIKNCVSEKKAKKKTSFLGVWIFTIIMVAAYGSKMVYKKFYSANGSGETNSYFAQFNGLDSIFYLVLALVVVSVIVDGIDLYYKSTLKKKILLEDNAQWWKDCFLSY